MNRRDWLQGMRRVAEERYDALHAPVYDENWGAISPTHERLLNRFLDLCPAHGLILDAACGTGKYWQMILRSGRAVSGTDQSQGMLERARQKHPEVPTEKLGLQEMGYREAFDGAICMDAMEMVFPEDWPVVLGNLHRALKPSAYLYFTVEIAAESDIENDYAAGLQLGLPVVYGESAHEGGYHYYPKIEQVRQWLEQADLRLIDEAAAEDYHHFLVEKL